jgi:hypothetical protein
MVPCLGRHLIQCESGDIQDAFALGETKRMEPHRPFLQEMLSGAIRGHWTR